MARREKPKSAVTKKKLEPGATNEELKRAITKEEPALKPHPVLYKICCC